MPRAKAPLKRDLLKRDLADALGLNVADILTRAEVVRDWGDQLGYKNEKSLSNADDVLVPCFYIAPLGKEGWALYSRRDLWLWVHDKAARLAMEKLGKQGRPYPWPVIASANPQPSAPPQPPPKSDAEVLLGNAFKDKVKDEDKDYMDMVLGRRPWA